MSATAAADPPHLDPELASLVERTRGMQPWRRVFHAGNGLLIALLPAQLGLGGPLVAATLAASLAALLLLDLARLRVVRVNALFFGAFPALASPREAAGIASSTWFVAGAAVVFAFFPMAIAGAAMLVLGLADPAAGVVGRLWGRRPLGKGTVLGSSAFFAVACAVLLGRADFPAALAAAAVATCVEALPWPLDDNLTVPIATAAALLLAGG